MSSTRIGIAEIRQAFSALGVRRGDTVVYHGSLKSMGWVDGGASAVIEGVLAAAAEVTAAVPTLWYDGTPARREEDFDPASSPAYNGALAEGMRLDPRSLRSCHYSHSVSAIGPRAAELTADHGKGETALSPWRNAFNGISPWSRFLEWDALYCFIGTGMKPCTMKHWVESRYLSRILDQLPAARREEALAEISPAPPRIWPMADMTWIQEEFDRRGLIRKTPLGDTEVLGIRTAALVENLMELFVNKPERCFRTPFLDFLARYTR